MNRRKFLEALPLLSIALAGCETGVKIDVPIDVTSIVDAVTDGLFKFAPSDLAAKLAALRTQLQAGGDWKATAKAFLPVAQEVLNLGVVPEPYSTLASTALGGLSILLGFVAAGPNAVTLSQARAAAAELRAMK